ncbi:MAG TPA: ImmA/IrrE family metallo-endopeptidase [Candidatus Saccharimonadales bacterium]|nr:ImmA/IrrE family metallo-endopeptidase [Candidatus Saccharimonadales bacterium]
MRGENDTLAVAKSDLGRFERGFKSWCENTAVVTRKKLGLYPSDPLPPRELAEHMGVKIMNLDEVGLNPLSVTYLSSAQGDEWSAVTVYVSGKKIIVVNPRHSDARQASNIMHELAHIIRGHEPSKVEHLHGYALRDFNQLQENEANWLAACLLLPRPALLYSGYRNQSIDEAVVRYGVSKSLYKYRTVVSGVSRQLRAARPF